MDPSHQVSYQLQALGPDHGVPDVQVLEHHFTDQTRLEVVLADQGLQGTQQHGHMLVVVLRHAEADKLVHIERGTVLQHEGEKGFNR